VATITLSNSYALDSLKLRGEKGMFEVTRDEVEISPFVASHLLASNNFVITFTESDKDSLMALPDREMSFLAKALSCEPSEVFEKLVPTKQIFKSKKKAKAKVVEAEALEDE
jgi:hypothetical protein